MMSKTPVSESSDPPEERRDGLNSVHSPRTLVRKRQPAVSTWWLDTIRTANRITNDYRGVLRSIAISGFRELMRLNILLPPPRVLLNGPPKSGTHLLSDCFSLLPRMMFSGKHFALVEFAKRQNGAKHLEPSEAFANTEIDEDRLHRFLGTCRNGMFVTAHAPFHPALEQVNRELGFRHIVLLRDPRDVVVSATKYVMRERWHEHHEYYSTVLRSDEERLMATIRGFDGSPPHVPPRISIGRRFAQYLPWLESPSILICRFEDLACSDVEGGRERAACEIRRIAEFVDRSVTAEQAAAIARRMYSNKSLTFRKGSIGDWKVHFGPEHRRAFKEEAGALLVRLGYERDEAW